MSGRRDDEALDRFEAARNPIRLELPRASNRAQDRGETLDLMEAMQIAETEDRFTSDLQSHSSAKKWRPRNKQG